jgi:hypothetical protein
MEPKLTTVGQLVINSVLPEEHRDYERVWDKSSMRKFLTDMAQKMNPDEYREMIHRLTLTGLKSARQSTRSSFTLEDLKPPKIKQKLADELRKEVRAIVRSEQNPKIRNERIVDAALKYQGDLVDGVYQEALKNDNPFAMQVFAGARGNKNQLASMIGTDLLYSDNKGRPVPIPVLNSYAEGVDPVEYWAGSYGARAGSIDVKLAVGEAGYFAKRLTAAAHRLVATDEDIPDGQGLMVETDDPDSIGSVLARDEGEFKRGTYIDSKVLKALNAKGVKRAFVYSPIAAVSAMGGLPRIAAGIREHGKLAETGMNVGITAAQAIAEPVSQGMLNCLAKSTLVRMADGSTKAIEEIVPGDLVLGADRRRNSFPVKVNYVFDNGVRDCHKTVFRVGNAREEFISIDATLDHKILARTGKWPWCKEDYVDDVVPLGTRSGSFSALRPTSCVSDDSARIRFDIPGLIGALLGDGCYTRSVKQVHLSCFDPSMLEDLEPEVSAAGLKFSSASNFGYYRVSQIRPVTTTEGGTLQVVRNPVKAWLIENKAYGKYAHEKTLPDQVFDWDNRSVARLIGGLYSADGCVFLGGRDGKTPHLYLASTSLEMLKQVQELLQARFGIFVRLQASKRIQTGRKRALHRLASTDYASVLQFSKAIPLFGKKRVALKDALEAYVPPEQDRGLLKCGLVSQTSIGSIPTYDIEVDHPDHLFVLANGLIVSNSKHGGGVAKGKAKRTVTGFAYLNQLVEVPKTFTDGAPVSKVDGSVGKIEPAPQGGNYVYVNNERYYVPAEQAVTVKPGQTLEAGDALSDGVINPKDIADLKGIGEARRRFVQQFKSALQENGLPVHRRNVEVVARGLINQVEVTEPDAIPGAYPEDIVSYDYVAAKYEPRKGFQVGEPGKFQGQYLEKPVMHYSIGTRLTPSVVKELKDSGFNEVIAHPNPPPFKPTMTRAMESLVGDRDWMVQLGGFNLKKTFLENVQRGSTSQLHGTSWIPALASGEISKGPKGTY